MIPAATLATYQLPLSAEAITDLSAVAETIFFQAGEIVVKEESVCRELYFIQSGAARGFTTDDGLEYTHWFAFEKDFLTSFRSFITGKPAGENIQAIEPIEALRITKEDLYALFQPHREIESLVRKISERYYIRLETRFVSNRFRKRANSTKS